jgi:flagellar biosynthetic protein FliQ
MDVDAAADLGRHALYITLIVSVPAMLTGVAVGLLVSLFQSVTSIQEQTLSFVPKIVITLAVTIIALPWIMSHLIEYTLDLYQSIPDRF